MKKKTLLISLGVLLTGGLAYLFLRKKENGSTSVGNAVSEFEQEVSQTIKAVEEKEKAKNNDAIVLIQNKIADWQRKKDEAQRQLERMPLMPPVSGIKNIFNITSRTAIMNKISIYDKTINELQIQLEKLLK